MKSIVLATFLSVGMDAGAAGAAFAPDGARPAPRTVAATVLAQGGGTVLPPEARCPQQQPPSHRHIQNPYVIWICRQAGGTQFDYYLGAGYLYSLIVPG